MDSKRDDVAHCSPKNQDVNQDIELTSESLNYQELGGPEVGMGSVLRLRWNELGGVSRHRAGEPIWSPDLLWWLSQIAISR